MLYRTVNPVLEFSHACIQLCKRLFLHSSADAPILVS